MLRWPSAAQEIRSRTSRPSSRKGPRAAVGQLLWTPAEAKHVQRIFGFLLQNRTFFNTLRAYKIACATVSSKPPESKLSFDAGLSYECVQGIL